MNKKDLLKLLDSVEEQGEETVEGQRVLMIDGLNLFFRNFAMLNAVNPDGIHVGGLGGFFRSLGALIRQIQPTSVYVVFDGAGSSNNRKNLLPEYKSGRNLQRITNWEVFDTHDDEDDAKIDQIVRIIQYLKSLPVKTVSIDKVEADDIIAYLSKIVPQKEQDKVFIVSSDKDFLQLVDFKTTVYSPTKKKTYTPNLIREEYGISPQNFLFYRVLDGDKSDNVPGVDGCGLKTIIKRFPELCEDREVSLDELYKICEEKIKEAKVYQNVLNSKEIIDRNIQIMQLSDPTISTSDKLKIMNRFSEPNKSLNKIEFIKAGMKHKVLESWKDINDWLISTFNNIVVK